MREEEEKMENTAKKSITDRMIEGVEKISGPFNKLAGLPSMQAIQQSMMAIMPV